MSTQTGLKILERAAEARGKMLRVEADRDGATAGILVFTFDVGRVLVTPSADGLEVAHIEATDALPPGLVALEEDEPWWRLLGNPLTAAWPGGVETGVGARGLGSLMVLKLRFRDEGENPRVVQLEATGNAIRVSLV
jgi:hypothetical protein